LAANTKSILQVIHPTSVYSLEAAREALGLARATLGREIRLGRLRVSKRAGRYFILGAWLLEWLEAGEVRRKPVADKAPALIHCNDVNPN
jgi:hypothetical protein